MLNLNTKALRKAQNDLIRKSEDTLEFLSKELGIADADLQPIANLVSKQLPIALSKKLEEIRNMPAEEAKMEQDDSAQADTSAAPTTDDVKDAF